MFKKTSLELGGKNHTIVDKTANIKDAAEKILWSKYVNCGQTCIAANHVFVHTTQQDLFASNLEVSLKKFFSESVAANYGEIVNTKHIQRLKKILNDCLNHSGEIICASNDFNDNNSFPIISISLIMNVSFCCGIKSEIKKGR